MLCFLVRIHSYNSWESLKSESWSGTYSSHDDHVKVCEDVLHTSVALSVSEDGVPTFAAMVSKEAETTELEAVSGATFTDLRVGLFLVNEIIAHELSKVRS